MNFDIAILFTIIDKKDKKQHKNKNKKCNYFMDFCHICNVNKCNTYVKIQIG